jgi:hypothetical protein
MIFNRPTRIAIIIVMALLTVNLCVCGMLAYQGGGTREVGPRQARSSTIRTGSVGGPSIFGGGSSSGK